VPVPESGSISLRLYPHNGLDDATAVVDELLAQAVLAAEAGFDGVLTSEHHGGFGGYSPNPLQLAGWMLDAMPTGWCAPCPMLLPLRPVALVAEEVAWLAARFPDRVAVGVAPGALRDDFEIMDVPFDELIDRFRAGLPRLTALLRGEELGLLAGDRALEACARRPVTVISTAMSRAAARRSAAAGAGVVYDGASEPARLGQISEAYDAAGGTAPKVLIRRVWLGDPPVEAFDRQLEVYRSYTPAAAQQHWRDNGFLCREDGAALADDLLAARTEAGGTGPKVLIRRVWLGDPPVEAFDRQLEVYRSYTPAAAQQHWRDNGFVCREDGAALVEDLLAARTAAGADVLNLRIHVDGVAPAQAREQIARLGAEVVPLLRNG
jgi:alkanesulfonate monooxygenase SsuD/methylene tetrahydromethanopterin reductase-like flavin-dependent oxidoreductase (luciferase family)